MNITVGTMSPHKLTAVRQACEKWGIKAVVSGVKTSSGQNEQPIGFEETFAGALARAIAAKSERPNDIAIGIESGIFRINHASVSLDIAIIVILTEDRQIVTTSKGIQFPEEYVQTAEERSFITTTVGSIIADQFGGDPTDPHSILTQGKITRTMILVDAVTMALQQV